MDLFKNAKKAAMKKASKGLEQAKKAVVDGASKQAEKAKKTVVDEAKKAAKKAGLPLFEDAKDAKVYDEEWLDPEPMSPAKAVSNPKGPKPMTMPPKMPPKTPPKMPPTMPPARAEDDDELMAFDLEPDSPVAPPQSWSDEEKQTFWKAFRAERAKNEKMRKMEDARLDKQRMDARSEEDRRRDAHRAELDARRAELDALREADRERRKRERRANEDALGNDDETDRLRREFDRFVKGSM